MPDAVSVLRGEKPQWKDYFQNRFSGEGVTTDEAELHFQDFQSYYTQYGATLFADIKELFRRTLTGKAKLWLSRANISSVERLEEEFLKKFGNPKAQSIYVRSFYSPKLEEGEDIETYAFRIQEAAKALGVSDEGKIKNSFIKGLPSNLYNLVLMIRESSFGVLVSKTSEYMEYMRDTRASVDFQQGENVNVSASTKKNSGARSRSLLGEEREMGLVRQLQGLTQATRDLQGVLARQGPVGNLSDSDSESCSEEEARFGHFSSSRGRSYKRSGNVRRYEHPSPNQYRNTHRGSGHRPRSPRGNDQYPSRNRAHLGDRRNLYHKDRSYSRERTDRYSKDRSYSRERGHDRFRDKGHSHYRRDGSQLRDRNRVRQIICDRCGQPGHIARRCRAILDQDSFSQDFH